MPGPFGKLIGGTFVVSAPTQLTTVPQSVGSVLVQNDPSSTTNLLVGGVAGQWIVLGPGDSEEIRVSSPTLVYVANATGTPTCNWLAEAS